MKSIDHVGITFANLVIGQGVFNNVVNVTLGAMQFTPEDGKVDADPAIVSRLRLDIPCAIALRDVLNKLLESVKETHSAPPPPPGDISVATDGKPN